MVETTLDIRFSADDEPSVVVTTSAAGDAAREAQLLCIAQYAARTLNEPPRERASHGDSSVRIVARYLNGGRGPRTFLRMRPRGGVAEGLRALQAQPEPARAVEAVELLARKGRLTAENEFNVALAAADLASERRPVEAGDVQCPRCGDAGPFDALLWPGAGAAIRKCAGCGAGLWLRRRRRPRLLPAETWAELESLRAALADGVDGSLLDGLRQAFVENRWPFAEVHGAAALVSELSGPRGSWKFYAQAVDEQDLVLLYSICPVRVPPDRRNEIADYITRTNYGLAAGNFELDFADGELRYKTALHVRGDDLDGRLLKRVVRANGLAMETYLAGVEAVVAGMPGSAAGIENQDRVG